MEAHYQYADGGYKPAIVKGLLEISMRYPLWEKEGVEIEYELKY